MYDKKFLWGCATAAYQIEGATNSGGRGACIWDTFVKIPGNIKEGANADIADNSYYQYIQDVQLLKDMGLNTYRFSISWSRILPSGRGKINKEGVDYYNKLIDLLISSNIEPNITLYHWDLPETLQQEYNGWLCKNNEIVKDFGNYANICFKLFGDRVKIWATINEPHTCAIDCYEYNYFAPGSGNAEGISLNGDEYLCAYNMLNSHAQAVHVYRKKYQKTQKGRISIVCNMDCAVPYTDTPEDIAAAERRNCFWGAWFWDPIFFGDYPKIMKELVGDRLPKFTKQQKKLLKGSIDILMLNHYSANYIQNKKYPNDIKGWMYDQETLQSFTDPSGVFIGTQTQSSWLLITPYGVKNVLLWLQNRYTIDNKKGFNIKMNSGEIRSIPLMITENGVDLLNENQQTTYVEAKNDALRIYYYQSYLLNMREAVDIAGIEWEGYYAWSLLDNFEWAGGYTCRFGMTYVSFDTHTNQRVRLLKDSAIWYKNYIKNNKYIK